MRDYGFGRKAKYVVVLDCDGTIIKPSIMQTLVDAKLITRSSSLARTNELISRGIRGTLTPEDERAWFNQSLYDIVRAQISLAQVYKVLREIRLKPGVLDCLAMLWNAGVPVALVSYGVAEFMTMGVPEDYFSAIFAA